MRNAHKCLILGAALLLAGCSSITTPNGAPNPPIALTVLTITTTSLSNGTAGSSYSSSITASGGTTPYTYSASGLPSGMSIGSSTGAITGTPAQGSVGTASVAVTVLDSTQPTKQSATAKLSLTIQASKLVITTASLANATAGSSYSASITASGGTTPYTFKATGLPSGLSIGSSTGAITGTPAQSSVGTASVVITVTDSTQPTAQSTTATLSLTVVAPVLTNPLTITTTSLPEATVGSTYSASIAASGGIPPYTYSASGLPSGLAIGSSTGAITGTPAATSVGTASVAITVTDSTQPTPQSANTTLSLVVNAATTPSACAAMSTGDDASLNGFVPFQPTDAWDTNISSAPLDPDNAAITSAAGFAGLHLHHDFSSTAGGNYGIPYVVVDSSTTPLVPISVPTYPSQSDVAYAPFPPNAPIEGSPAACTGGPNNYQGDQHVLVLDRNRCMLYETFNSVFCNGAWSADSETIWDLKNLEKRPWGWTSADAAGLAIFPGLLRYDEVAAGAIKHAIRFTMQQTKNDANGGYFVEPATHAAGNILGVSNVMGMRIRLKASFDISGYSAANQVILTAMKNYGMIVADNGGYFYFQGAPDPRWDDNDLENLDSIKSSNFEVVQMAPTFPGWDAVTAPTGPPPTINSFTASASTVAAGTPVTLTWDTTNDSYDFIDVLGGVSGGTVTTAPTATTTYTLNATNQYGRSTAQVTVTVR